MIDKTRLRSTLEAIALPVGAVLVALIAFGIFCSFAGANPFGVYAAIHKAAFSDWRRWQGTLLRAAPLMLSALCTVLPARIGLVIIGNEGAIILGGIGALLAGLAFGNAPPVLAVLLMAIAGMILGGIWIAIAGALRYYRGVNETISSLLLNYIAIAFMNELVENSPLRDPSFLNKPSSYALSEAIRLGNLPGTRIHYGLLYGLIACVIGYVLIQRTTFGFAVRTAGGNIKAARLAGLPVGKLTLIVCFLAGSCAGLAGMVEVSAVHGSVSGSLNSNYGYSGVLVAFVARQNPLAAVLVSVMLGGILASGGILQRAYELPDATVLVFQGLVFLAILYSESLYGRLPIFKETVKENKDGGGNNSPRMVGRTPGDRRGHAAG